ncbi:short-chain dehydrogenase [Dyadobacter beijingensis]|uniref:Short-chain dehydrogenase n=1 Tax=Dyadobacter beijingensis TaxID=365489 RepID=A0ABQ2HUA9_9BACT|nr:SDR family NAD(P)-dependent oxidoreductase [Dyadobacter beijingensis]GGM89574.1 short-chain dehydrogenase [Dyadobacter beijingensis]
MRKTALITGPTSGIGRHTALGLARMGFDLILVARNEAKTRELQKEIGDLVETTFVLCDLSSMESVRRAVGEIKSSYGQIDLLVNNAGLIVQHRQTTGEGIELTFATNHLGPFVLTTGLADLLKAAGSARVINLASAAHYFAFRYQTAKLANPPHYQDLVIYGRTKLANILFSNELSERMALYGVTSNAVHPGTVASGFAGDGHGATAWFMKAFRAVLRTPERAAADIIHVATAPELDDVTGRYFVNAKPARTSGKARSRALARELWTFSETLNEATSEQNLLNP